MGHQTPRRPEGSDLSNGLYYNTSFLAYIQEEKGDALECVNYREIALLKTCYKVVAQCLRSRLNEQEERKSGEYQARFRYNRSVTD